MTKPDLVLEGGLWKAGYRVLGCDEAARGTWAGSLWVGMVCLRELDRLIVSELLDTHGLNDSKKMTPKQRAYTYRAILETGIPYAVADATVSEVDELGIEAAFRLALNRAGAGLLQRLRQEPPDPNIAFTQTALLIDGARYHNLKVQDPGLGMSLRFEIVAQDKLDQKSATVALASVVAKVHAEITMLGLGRIYPGYGFERHGGYPTAAHKAAVEKHGLTRVHRKTWDVK